MRKIAINETGMVGWLVEGYHELKPKSQIELLRLAYSNPKSEEVKLMVWGRLMQAPKEMKQLLKQPENRDELWRLLSWVDWVWLGPKALPLAWIKIRGKKYCLPDEYLTRITVGEFVVATAHLIGFGAAKNDTEARRSMRLFIATIARPKPDALQQLRRDKASWNGDPREAYNTYRCEQRAELFGRLSEAEAIGLMQWWNMAVTRLLKQYGLVSDESDETTSLSQGQFVRDWQKEVVMVAKNRAIGETIDKVYARSIHEFFAYVNVEKELKPKE